MEKRFEAATREGVSPSMWIPPEWSELKTHDTKPRRVFVDTCKRVDPFEDDDVKERIDAMVADGKRKDANPVKSPESLPDDNSWPHPFADTSHVDESEFSSDDHTTLGDRLSSDRHLLTKLHGIVGESSPGMKRLTGIFNWILYRATVLMGDLNQGLKEGLKDPTKYETARFNYIEFLKDLDDHEPEKGTKKSPRDIARQIAASKAAELQNKSCDQITEILATGIEQRLSPKLGKQHAEKRAWCLAKELGGLLKNQPHEKVKALSGPKLDMRKKWCASGYGRAIKWTCIDPVIFDGQIVGTRVVAKWNPHECSSGIPIPHK